MHSTFRIVQIQKKNLVWFASGKNSSLAQLEKMVSLIYED